MDARAARVETVEIPGADSLLGAEELLTQSQSCKAALSAGKTGFFKLHDGMDRLSRAVDPPYMSCDSGDVTHLELRAQVAVGPVWETLAALAEYRISTPDCRGPNSGSSTGI